MHLIAQLLPGFAYNCPTVTTQFVTDIRLRYFLIPLHLWENKKMWDLKLNLYAVHHGMNGMNPWFYQSVMTMETVGLFKTAERNPEKKPQCETHSPRPFTNKSRINTNYMNT